MENIDLNYNIYLPLWKYLSQEYKNDYFHTTVINKEQNTKKMEYDNVYFNIVIQENTMSELYRNIPGLNGYNLNVCRTMAYHQIQNENYNFCINFPFEILVIKNVMGQNITLYPEVSISFSSNGYNLVILLHINFVKMNNSVHQLVVHKSTHCHGL